MSGLYWLQGPVWQERSLPPNHSASNPPGPEPPLFCQLTQTKQYGHQQMWVIDMAYLHNINLIAVASTELKIGESVSPGSPDLPLASSHGADLLAEQP